MTKKKVPSPFDGRWRITSMERMASPSNVQRSGYNPVGRNRGTNRNHGKDPLTSRVNGPDGLGAKGFEPLTPSVSSWCSSQLS